MKLNYTNVLDSNTVAMTLYGEIGTPGWEADMFTAEMRYHNQMGRKIKVYINSPGGSVFGGYSIIQAIMDYEADTHIVGIAASMGGIIAQFGKNRSANDFAVGMIHLPSGPKDTSDKLLDIVKDGLLNILDKRMTLARVDIEELMEQETFFDASEMLEMGLVDEIVTTNVTKVENVKSYSPSDLYNVYNSIINKTNSKMEKLKAHFSLSGEVTEDKVLDRVNDIENALSEKEGELAEKTEELAVTQAELSKTQTELQELRNESAERIVDQAITDGKIEKAKKSIWLDAAKKDPKGTEEQLSSIATASNMSVQTSIINQKADEKKPEDDIVNWVRNNGAKLIELEKENPDRFDELMNLYNQELSKQK